MYYRILTKLPAREGLHHNIVTNMKQGLNKY